MAITLSRDAYVKYRCFGLPDEYPKDTRQAVLELRRRGYDASESLLDFLVEERKVRIGRDGWQAADIDRAAEELAEMEAYTVEAKMFERLGIDVSAS